MTNLEAARALAHHEECGCHESAKRLYDALRAVIAENNRALVVLRERYGHASIEDAERLTTPPTDAEHGAHHDRSCACWQRRPDCGCYLWDQDCPHFTPPTAARDA